MALAIQTQEQKYQGQTERINIPAPWWSWPEDPEDPPERGTPTMLEIGLIMWIRRATDGRLLPHRVAIHEEAWTCLRLAPCMRKEFGHHLPNLVYLNVFDTISYIVTVMNDTKTPSHHHPPTHHSILLLYSPLFPPNSYSSPSSSSSLCPVSPQPHQQRPSSARSLSSKQNRRRIFDVDACVLERVSPFCRVIWYPDIKGFAMCVISKLTQVQAGKFSWGSLQSFGMGCRRQTRTKKYRPKNINAA